MRKVDQVHLFHKKNDSAAFIHQTCNRALKNIGCGRLSFKELMNQLPDAVNFNNLWFFYLE